MKLGIPRECYPGECRVAATPATVRKLRTLGFEVSVERSAGANSKFPDSEFVAAGANLSDASGIWSCDVIAKIRPPNDEEIAQLGAQNTLVCLLQPDARPDVVEKLVETKANVIALDKIPRITRAQKMDVLSSMANIAGYRAVIEAATVYGGFFGGQITAAGKTRPAQVLVLGAGVAGLAAIASARGLGAEVRAFDVRPAVREQVESLGAVFLELEFEEEGEGGGGYAKEMSPAFLEAERKLFMEQAREVDIIITTALIPGKKAPLLIEEDMVKAMRPGSVIVDLAAEQGGNAAFTQADQVIDVGGVTIIGYTDLTSRLPTHASQFFGTNVYHLLDEMGGAENFRIDVDDEAIRGALVTKAGALMWPPPPPPKPPEAVKPETRDDLPRFATQEVPAVGPAEEPKEKREWGPVPGLLIGALGFGLISLLPGGFVQQFTVFLLACFVGWHLVWEVTPALHTPLMSVTNAISGIIIVGGILQASAGTFPAQDYLVNHSSMEATIAMALGAVAILVASINVAGGFLVTQRMLQMFRK